MQMNLVEWKIYGNIVFLGAHENESTVREQRVANIEKQKNESRCIIKSISPDMKWETYKTPDMQGLTFNPISYRKVN